MKPVEEDHLLDLPPVLSADLRLGFRPADAVFEEHLHEGRVVLGVVEPGHNPFSEEVSDRPFHELVSRGIFERDLNDALAEVPYDLFDRLRDLVWAP